MSPTINYDPLATGRKAKALFDRGHYAEAASLYRLLCSDPNSDQIAYDDWVRGLSRSLARLEQGRSAAYLDLYLQEFDRALAALANREGVRLDKARVLAAQGRHAEAATIFEEEGKLVQAAIAYEKAADAVLERSGAVTCPKCRRPNAQIVVSGTCRFCTETIEVGAVAPLLYKGAIRCWKQLEVDGRFGEAQRYERALVSFNLGYCQLRLGLDAEGTATLVQAQRLLEEAADAFETEGLRERAFDCYQILLEIGRRSEAFENLAEGFVNCIRIVKEDNLKYYVIQYYEDFIREALAREEFHAAATLYREAADYCQKAGLIYDRYYMRASAKTWLKLAERTTEADGPPEMAENACLAAVECFNSLGDYRAVGATYTTLSRLELSDQRRSRYEKISERYQGVPENSVEEEPFPDSLRQPHAYPAIWYMDLVEWEHGGQPLPVCVAVVGDPSYPDIVRRRALAVLLELLEEATASSEGTARVAERLGDLLIYPVLRVLERLFDSGDAQVQRGVMRAVRNLFFKRSFVVLNRGLRAADPQVKLAAIESLGRLCFYHAFDALVRIFREHEDPMVKRTALHSIGRIPELQAGDFLLEVLRYENEPLRSDAMQLLIQFKNQEFFPVLRQHYHASEPGKFKDELGNVIQRLGR